MQSTFVVPKQLISALVFSLAMLTCAASCYTYQAAPAYSAPSKFDRAWDAARGAAADSGVTITSADRASGMIYGSAYASDVAISVLTQADATVRVEINVTPTGAGADPQLGQRITAAYQRRMGR